MFKSLKVAYQILKLAKTMNINDITPLKLQKLLYLAYEKHAIDKSLELFPNKFEVWRHGPVEKDVYDHFKRFSSEVIDSESNDFTLDEIENETIKQTLKEYGRISAWDLVDITHDPNGIWYKKMQEGEKEIQFKDVCEYAK